MQDLNLLIPQNTGWTLFDAFGINDAGQIAVDGRNASGQSDAFLLTPVPEPAVLLPGLVLVAAMYRKRKPLLRV